jgi:hypothetical protein
MSINVHWWQPPPLWVATPLQKGSGITAHYGTHANYGIQEADGSIPFSSTNSSFVSIDFKITSV